MKKPKKMKTKFESTVIDAIFFTVGDGAGLSVHVALCREIVFVEASRELSSLGLTCLERGGIWYFPLEAIKEIWPQAADNLDQIAELAAQISRTGIPDLSQAN